MLGKFLLLPWPYQFFANVSVPMRKNVMGMAMLAFADYSPSIFALLPFFFGAARAKRQKQVRNCMLYVRLTLVLDPP